MARLVLPAVLLAAVLVAPARAHAVEKEACMAAAESAQELRRQKKPGEARLKLAICSDASCPNFVRADCKTWMQEVLATFAPVTIRATDAHGHAATELRIYADGVAMEQTAVTDGAIELELEPGRHSLRFDYAGSPSIMRSVDAVSRQRLDIALKFEVAAPLVPWPVPVPSAQPLSSKATPPYVYVGGVGLVGAAVGIPFQAIGMVKVANLHNCKGDCTVGSTDDARTALWVGNIGLGVAVVALGTAVVLYALRPEPFRWPFHMAVNAASGSVGVYW